MRALICDDDGGTRLLVRHLLVNKLGWSVVECADGVEALQALGRGHFDLAILDINMPQLDGIGVVEAIRTSPTLRSLPIVMLTSDQREESVRRLLELRVTDYIIKPLVTDAAIAKLQRIQKTLTGRQT